MARSKTTKRALVASVCATLMCIAMLIGTTFAWFTDTASTSVNKIQSGTLDVALQMKSGENWVSAEGQTLNFGKAAGHETEDVLWEPGCTYELPAIRVVNEGSLAFKYQLVVSGAIGDTKLLDAIEFTVKDSSGSETVLTDMEGIIIPAGKTPASDNEKVQYSDVSGMTIKAHMKEEAGNEYQDLSIEGISVTVYATQYTYEYDSYNKTYDDNSMYVFDDYVNVTKTVETDAETKIEGESITATLPQGSVDSDITELALIKKPTSNPSNIIINSGENAITTDVKIIDTTTKQVITAKGDTFFTIDIQLGQVDLQKFYHKGVELTKIDSNAAFTTAGQYKYDFTSGVVTFTTKDFSAFTAKVKYSGGNGTAEYPYLLSTANDLIGLANTSTDATGGKYFKLANDIKLPSSWTAIANFAGTIDGNEKTITFTGTNGLITTLQSGSTIKDLTLTSSTAKNALLAYLTYGSASAPTTISGVTTNGSVSYVAALIGWLYTAGSGSSDTPEAFITNCTNNATVNGDGGNRAVGLVGTVKTLNVEFNGCVNNGNLTITTTKEAHAAGIAGYVMKMNKETDTSVVKVINCTNTGAINAKSTNDGRANVGGIVSTAHQGTFTITNCTNTGAITGTDSTTKNQSCVGGIVGRVNSTTTISGGSNAGAITANATQNKGKAYAGAAVGYDQYNVATITDFTNTGAITANSPSAS